MTHIIEVEHEGITVAVQFRGLAGRDGIAVEDLTVLGVEDPSEELLATAEKAALDWITGALAEGWR